MNGRQPRQPRQPTGGTGVLLMLLLALVVGILAFIGWRSTATHAPTPSATANPAVRAPNQAPKGPTR
jgi:hypothetical protein